MLKAAVASLCSSTSSAETSNETKERKHRLSYSSTKAGSRFAKQSESYCDNKMALPSRRSLVERPPTARSKAKGGAILPKPALLPRPSNEDTSCEGRVQRLSATEQNLDINAEESPKIATEIATGVAEAPEKASQVDLSKDTAYVV